MRFRNVLFAAPLAAFAAVIACTDPPPPALGHVWIHRIDDRANSQQVASATYLRGENGTEGDISKGITVASGLSVPVVFLRTVENPPDDSNKSQQLLNKVWKLTVTGDAFTAQTTQENDQLVINANHDGDGQLILTVDGLTGSATVPIHVVDQGTVPDNIYINVVPEASTPTEDAAPEATTTDDTDAGDPDAQGPQPVP